MNNEKKERKRLALDNEKGESRHQLCHEHMERKQCMRGK
jgi:hypothetical protein